MIHSISTGYAGMLGAILQRRWGCNFLLSEHGIYTKERKIDLAQAKWIAEGPDEALRTGLDVDVSYIRRLGSASSSASACSPTRPPIRSSRSMTATAAADPGRRRSRALRVIPNGISLTQWQDALRAPGLEGCRRVGLGCGRVVPIKDVKTFIRAMRGVISAMPEAEAWVVGPEDEDEEYAAECHSLVTSLGLEGKVKFLGFQKIGDILPKLGLMVLTSISEAQPLVILEGWAAGVPVCEQRRGLLPRADRGFHPRGPRPGHRRQRGRHRRSPGHRPRHPRPAAQSGRWQAAQRTGLARVNRYYTEPLMLERYRELYRTPSGGSSDMAGIGFELRKILARDSYTATCAPMSMPA